jgi:anaerobic magnesium-protoporphyrin IX monomethyl ester cyclase
MAKIAFVNPPLSIEDRYGLKTQGGGISPPIGLTHLAAMTREYGHETIIIDAAVMNMGYEETAREIIDNGFRYVGFTAVTISIGHAARLTSVLKNADNGITVIIGGPHLSAIPFDTMSMFPEFDIGVIGEGDYAIVEVVHAVEERKPLDRIEGLIVRKNGEIFTTQPRKRIKELDKLPMPAWDLLPDLAKYYSPPVHTLKRMPGALLVTSRGCSGSCSFCANSVFGRVLRTYSAEYTFAMIKDLYNNYGIREIQLRDDNFAADHKRLIRLCEILKREKLDIVWTCTGRVDMVNSSILKMMKETGCWQIWYGIESGSQAVLNAIKKNITIEQIERAVQMTHDAGIMPCGFFMIGNPTETKESLEDTIDMAVRLPLEGVHFTFMTPLPGTELYNRAKEFGQFDNNWSKLTCWLPVFVPTGLTAKDLEYYSKKAFRRFYLRPRIIFAYAKKLRSWRHFKFFLLGFLSLLEHLVIRRSKRVFVDD